MDILKIFISAVVIGIMAGVAFRSFLKEHLIREETICI